MLLNQTIGSGAPVADETSVTPLGAPCTLPGPVGQVLPIDKDAGQGPTGLLPEHLREFTEGRGIPAELVRLNVASFGPGTARHWESERAELLAVRRRQIAEGSVAGNGHLQTQAGHVADRLRQLDQRYRHLEHGGWRTTGAALPGLEAFDQWKPTRPRGGQGFGKAIKYEAQPGAPTGAFLPHLTPELWAQVAERANLPADALEWGDNPWGVVAGSPEVELVITEGAGKALAITSLGYAAIGLPGVWNGRRVTRDEQGRQTDERLIPELQAFAAPGRRVTFLFDADRKASTCHAVEQAALKTGALLQRAGCQVRIARLPLLPGHDKTGADDLLVAKGPEALAQVIEQAEPLATATWRHLNRACRRFLRPGRALQVADLSAVGLERPTTPIVAIRSPKGTGKTKLLNQWLKNEPVVVMPTHRVSLGSQTAKACGLVWRNDLDAVASDGMVLRFSSDGVAVEGVPDRYSLCLESLLSLAGEIERYRGRGLIFVADEARQLLAHALNSDTLREIRALVLEVLRALVAVAEQVILLDADLDDATIRWFQEARREAGAPDDLTLIENHHQQAAWPVQRHVDGTPDEALAELVEAVKRGERPFITTDSRGRAAAIHHLLAQAVGLAGEGEVASPICGGLLINSDTTDQAEVRQAMAELINADALARRGLRWAVASPSISTGLSIEHDHFASVWGFYGAGTYDDADALQALARVRQPVPRHVWVSPHVTPAQQPLSRAQWPGAVERDLERRHRAQQALRAQQSQQQQLEPRRRPLLAGVDREVQYASNRDAWAAFTAARNASLANLRGFIHARLIAEGHQVVEVGGSDDPEQQDRARRVREDRALQLELRQQVDAEQTAAAAVISPSEGAVISRAETRTAAQNAALRRLQVSQALALPTGASITPEDVLWADQYAGKARALAEVMSPELAAQRDAARLAAIHATGSRALAWDERYGLTRSKVAEAIGLTRFLQEVVLAGEAWSASDPRVAELAQACRNHAREVQDALGVKASGKDGPAALVGRLLGRFGVTTIRRQVRQAESVVSTYRADGAQLERLLGVADRLSHLVPGANTTAKGVTDQSPCAAVDLAEAPAPAESAPTTGPWPVPEAPAEPAPDWFPALVAAREEAPGAAPEVVALQLARQGLLLAGREVGRWLALADAWLAEGFATDCCGAGG